MANGTPPNPSLNHIRYIVACITFLGVLCLAGGTVLTFKGYGGDLLIGGGLSAISGLIGMLAMGRPNTPLPDVTLQSQPPKVELTQPAEVKP